MTIKMRKVVVGHMGQGSPGEPRHIPTSFACQLVERLWQGRESCFTQATVAPRGAGMATPTWRRAARGVSRARGVPGTMAVVGTGLAAVAIIVAMMMGTAVPAGASTHPAGITVRSWHSVAVVPPPITKAYPRSEAGILPPANPAANIPPDPNFFTSCSSASLDESQVCTQATLQAIANARAMEGLAPMTLPADWYSLTPSEQLFVATDLERTVRGLPPLSAMATVLDQAAAGGAAGNSDPVPPPGFPASMWTSNWAGGMGSPLEAVYLWMYDDGPGSPNADCMRAGDPGCWGHRDDILANFACNPCVMGAAVNLSAWQGSPSWAEVLVDTSGSPEVDFSWTEVLPRLPGGPGGAGMLAPAVGTVAAPGGKGYWIASSDGGIFNFGDAGFFDSMAGSGSSSPVVGMAATPDGRGYWLVGSNGGVFSFGDAGFYGSLGTLQVTPSSPVVGMAATPDGRGYWLVGSDGGVFAFDSKFYGSMGSA
ncbi:MAG: hypothetical protein ACYCTL_02780 [Acidimicrobiales bacterium]